MKKLLLIPTLLISTISFATEYNWELTPAIGFNLPSDDKVIDDSTVYGGAIQYNGFEYPIKPEFQYLYTKADNVGSNTEAEIERFVLNGVYSFEKVNNVIPSLKAGIGIEDRENAGDESNGFWNIGAGVKIPQTDKLAIKLEAIRTFSSSLGHDDATILLAGLNYSFGAKVAAPVPAPVDGDDDNDGVKNSMDKCPRSAPYTKVDATGCEIVDGDDDNDGVKNSIDKCPTTPAGKTVDASGCCPVDGDDDKDGVLNSVDSCPNTPSNVSKVDSEGCASEVNLHVNFKFDSYEVTEDSLTEIKDFATFMNERATYKASIEGHTDSKGSAAYNQKLSENRAKAVTNLIISEGNVDASRLSSVGKGESEPIADNATKAGRAENRRTVAKIIKE